jgi:hypothetical protein
MHRESTASTPIRAVHAEQHTLSFLNNMMHSPAIFKEQGSHYTSHACMNQDIVIEKQNIEFPSGVAGHQQIQANINNSEDFVLLLIFKLLDRNIFISDRNVAVLEPHTPPSGHMGTHTGTKGSKALLARYTPMHCDVMAFNAKKRLIYSISICDDPKHFRATCAHGLRLAKNINHIKEVSSTVVPLVLTMYAYHTQGTLRLYNPLSHKPTVRSSAVPKRATRRRGSKSLK